MTDYCSYEEFGRDFFRNAVTKERVLASINVLAGEPIDFGPIGVGPGRLAKASAKGNLQRATIERVGGEHVRFHVELPAELHLSVDLQLDTQHFDARLVVPLELTARALRGCTVFIEALAPLPEQVHVELKADGLRASLLQRAAGVDDELRRFVAKYVTRELERPAVQAARTIDVARAIDSSWSPT